MLMTQVYVSSFLQNIHTQTSVAFITTSVSIILSLVLLLKKYCTHQSQNEERLRKSTGGSKRGSEVNDMDRNDGVELERLDLKGNRKSNFEAKYEDVDSPNDPEKSRLASPTIDQSGRLSSPTMDQPAELPSPTPIEQPEALVKIS